MPYKHPYKYVDLAGVKEVKVDVEIADLVEALCYLGWKTDNSCQDNHDDRVWIAFENAYFAEAFLSYMDRKASDRLRDLVRGAATQRTYRIWQEDGHGHKDMWWVDSFTQPLPWPKAGMQILISVRFPRKHLAEVTKIIVKAAKKKRLVVEKRLKENKTYEPKASPTQVPE